MRRAPRILDSFVVRILRAGVLLGLFIGLMGCHASYPKSRAAHAEMK